MVARPVWWIAGAFMTAQVAVIAFAANGPFVDEGLYVVAGLRVLEGYGLADGYLAWFNGSPFVWPVIAALGHHAAGLAGARLMAAILSTVTLVFFAKTAEHLFDRSVAAWAALAFALNGLFLALAHFAVYDVPALTGLAVAMWCVTRVPTSRAWVIGAALATSAAVITKYGYVFMLLPLAGLLVSTRGGQRSGRALGLFLATVGTILAAYFWFSFGTVVPTSSSAYLTQTLHRTRSYVALLQILFGLVPLALASAGAIVAWREGRRPLAVTCVLALAVFPAFHLWTGNFVSGQKHVVAGFLFGYLLAGTTLARLWTSRPRAAVALLAGMTIWGALQCSLQDRSWIDARALTRHLVLNVERGEQVLADGPWRYTLDLYTSGRIESPTDVIDASYSPGLRDRDGCRIPWLVGASDGGEVIPRVVARCGHRPVLSMATPRHRFDAARLRLSLYSLVVTVYRLPRP